MKYTICVLSLLLSLTYVSCGQSTGLSKPLKESINKNNPTNLTKYLNEAKWNELYPKRYGIGLKDSINHNPDFYSFHAFSEAAALFPPKNIVPIYNSHLVQSAILRLFPGLY